MTRRAHRTPMDDRNVRIEVVTSTSTAERLLSRCWYFQRTTPVRVEKFGAR